MRPIRFRMDHTHLAGCRVFAADELVARGGERWQTEAGRLAEHRLPQIFPTPRGVWRRRPDFEQRVVNVKNDRADAHDSAAQSNGKRFEAPSFFRMNSSCAARPAFLPTAVSIRRCAMALKRSPYAFPLS